ncbi:hypothetical protein [Tritonibacter mobilis]|jgi:hypothetical protein|uniref:hypothetical protein n=1 Tax=Tritonibacter mobilis TaxID=379347 RepID=UPI000806B7C2|nr:hypothetical protein [Tritonibacter mobilis]MCA2006170.1 hypothetical protein [Tritonibacter mobilis]NKX38927.1 hypothetical protein [Rhodobacteraceae bacterium R_SAG5]
MMIGQQTAQMDDGILSLVREERRKALSPREWQFRLRGYGYAIRDEDGTQVLTRLPRGEAVGILPADMS